MVINLAIFPNARSQPRPIYLRFQIVYDVHAKALEQLLMESLNTFCPLKSFKVGPQAKAWINSELKTLSRRKQREWLKNDKKFDDLLSQFSTKYKAAAEKFMKRKIVGMKVSKPGQAYSVLKSTGAEPGDCSPSPSLD